MTDMVYEEHIILEAIDQLRLRKARPDFQRISSFLLRNFSVSATEVRAALEKCVAKEIVLKVEYKGNISYRNAARNRKVKHGNITFKDDTTQPASSLITGNSKKFGALLTAAFTELIVNEPDYLDEGVPGNELILKILAKDTVRSYTKKYLHLLIEKLVANGVLAKMESGNYLLGPNQNKPVISKNTLVKRNKRDKINIKNKKGVHNLGIKKSKMDVGANSNGNKNGNIRVGSRRKRAKKVFDPSDNNIPKSKRRGRPTLIKSHHEKHIYKSKDSSDNESKSETGSLLNTTRESGGVCSVCHNNNYKKLTTDRLVSCRECSNKAHLSCLNGEDMLLKLHPDNTWQCPHCKTCCICFETSDAGILMVCSICADAYHTGCHEPRINDKVQNAKWYCINCQMSEQLQVTEINPIKKSETIIQKLEQEELDLDPPKEELLPLIQSSSSDEDSKDSLRFFQTPPILSPQALPSPAESPEQKFNYSDFYNSYNGSESRDIIDPTIPDATHWTSEDVYNYFLQYFPEEANVFREQEIDGRSLLLMKRLDVLTSLKLKLGPALNIYRHVVKLQFRRDDPKLYWL